MLCRNNNVICTHHFQFCFQWFPDGQAVGTGGEDGSCKLFDLRNESDVFLNAMKCPGGSGEGVGVKSLAFSNTGRVLFAGHEDGVIYGWDLQREHIVRKYLIDFLKSGLGRGNAQ